MPVVCVLGIQNEKQNYKTVYDLFKKKISEFEPEAYQKATEIAGNFNDKIHRLQFGFVNVEKNSKVKEQVLAAFQVKNPKIIVVISQLNLVQVINNLS